MQWHDQMTVARPKWQLRVRAAGEVPPHWRLGRVSEVHINQVACVSDGNQVQVGMSVLAVQGVQCKV